MSTTWNLLLTGDAAERARETVAAIAGELDERGPELLAGRSEIRQPGLAGGAVGVALFFAYLAEAGGDEAHADTAAMWIDRASELLATSVTAPDLYTGFAGVGWCLQHPEGRLFESDDDGGGAIDEALETFLDNPAAAHEYDVIRGLAGIGIHALERLPRPAAARCMARVVELLEETAVEHGEGLCWFTPPEQLPEHQRSEYPHGYYNAGVAHGLPGVLPVLAGAVAAGVAVERARPLLDRAAAWLLARELEPEAASRFPY